MTMLPYNTGKVAIGRRFTPEKSHSSTFEEDFWQTVLTRKGKRKPKPGVLLTIYVAALVASYLLFKWVTR
jgi:hypothetical protein